MPSTERQLKAIMFSDVKSFSAMMADNEERTMLLIKEHREIIRSILAKHGGEEHGTAGDSFFVLFSSAVQAVTCAVEIQEAFHRRNVPKAPEEQVWIRVGIHVGDIIVDSEDGHVYGDGVNIAARTEPKADAGAICITQDVFEQVKRKLDLEYIDIGRHEMKNIVDAPRLYKIAVSGAEPPPAFSPSSPPRVSQPSATSRIRKGVLFIVLLVLVVGAVAAVFLLREPGPAAPNQWPDHPRLLVLPFTSNPEREVDKVLWPLADRMVVNRLAKAELHDGALERIDPLDVEAEMNRREISGSPTPAQALELALALKADVYLYGGIERQAGLVRIDGALAIPGKTESEIAGSGSDIIDAAASLAERVSKELHGRTGHGPPKSQPDAERAEPGLSKALIPGEAQDTAATAAWALAITAPWSADRLENFATASSSARDQTIAEFAQSLARPSAKDLSCEEPAGILEARYPRSLGPLARALCAFKRLDQQSAIELGEEAYKDLALRPWAADFLAKAGSGGAQDSGDRFEVYRDRARLFPEEPDHWSMLATFAMNEGQRSEAQTSLKVAESLYNDGSPSFRLALNGVRVALRAEDLPSARLWMKKLSGASPERSTDEMFRATIESALLHLQGRFSEAWDILEKARSDLSQPAGDSYTIVATMLFSTYLHYGELDKAEAIADEYLEFFSKADELDHWGARILALAVAARRGDIDDASFAQQATELASKIESLGPGANKKVADGFLCMAFAHAGSDEDATRILRQASPTNTMIAGCRYRAASSLAVAGRFADAAALYEKARSDVLYRANWHAELHLPVLFGQAQALEKLGETKKARALYLTVVELYSDADRDLLEVTESRTRLQQLTD